MIINCVLFNSFSVKLPVKSLGSVPRVKENIITNSAATGKMNNAFMIVLFFDSIFVIMVIRFLVNELVNK